MLTRLLIQNLATVEKQIVEFNPGFNVITGETGAGKSIVVKAMELILGDKCSKDLIRVERDHLLVEAEFDLTQNPECQNALEQIGLEPDKNLVVRRKVFLNGKNQILANDASINLVSLQSLGETLIDLHGQHTQFALSQSSTHIDYLDRFADLEQDRKQYLEIFQEYLDKKAQKKSQSELREANRQRIELLEFQIEEIEKASLSIEEEERLVEEHKVLNQTEKIMEILGPILEQDHEEAPLNQLQSQLARLKEAQGIDPKLSGPVEEIQSGIIGIEEAFSDLSRYASDTEIDPAGLDRINQRLSLIEKLKRKYGQSVADILAYLQESRTELENLLQQTDGLQRLDEDLKRISLELKAKAQALSDARKAALEPFEKGVSGHLLELGLEKSRFQVRFDAHKDKEKGNPAFTSKGADKIEFIISTNPGHPLKPLSSIASGGEISRIMLAIKTTLNQDITQGVLIFDEIDTGISGRVAETVGFKLKSLGSKRQVICVTHSPQIASKAETHLRVEKIQEETNTKTMITPIKDQDRIMEIARFIGGNKVTDKALSAAAEMLKETDS